jgi:hypothetical protein
MKMPLIPTKEFLERSLQTGVMPSVKDGYITGRIKITPNTSCKMHIALIGQNEVELFNMDCYVSGCSDLIIDGLECRGSVSYGDVYIPPVEKYSIGDRFRNGSEEDIYVLCNVTMQDGRLGFVLIGETNHNRWSKTIPDKDECIPDDSPIWGHCGRKGFVRI